VVKEIHGRQTDFLYTANGAKIRSVTIANLVKNIPNAVIRLQVQQKKLGEVIILLETDASKYRKEYDALLINEFTHRFGEGTTVIIKHVDEIHREKNGKFLLVKNYVKA